MHFRTESLRYHGTRLRSSLWPLASGKGQTLMKCHGKSRSVCDFVTLMKLSDSKELWQLGNLAASISFDLRTFLPSLDSWQRNCYPSPIKIQISNHPRPMQKDTSSKNETFELKLQMQATGRELADVAWALAKLQLLGVDFTGGEGANTTIDGQMNQRFWSFLQFASFRMSECHTWPGIFAELQKRLTRAKAGCKGACMFFCTMFELYFQEICWHKMKQSDTRHTNIPLHSNLDDLEGRGLLDFWPSVAWRRGIWKGHAAFAFCTWCPRLQCSARNARKQTYPDISWHFLSCNRLHGTDGS